MRSEDTLASPLVDSPKAVSSGESPFKSPQAVKSGDRSYTERASRTPGGKDVAVCYVTGAIEGTKECAALKVVHDSFGHRLSHHWDIL